MFSENKDTKFFNLYHMIVSVQFCDVSSTLECWLINELIDVDSEVKKCVVVILYSLVAFYERCVTIRELAFLKIGYSGWNTTAIDSPLVRMATGST